MDSIDGNIVAAHEVRNHLIRALPAQLVVVGRASGLIRESFDRDEIALQRSNLRRDFIELRLFVLRERVLFTPKCTTAWLTGL